MTPAAPDDAKKSFEQAYAELEANVRMLEDGDLPLDQSLAKFKVAVGLLQCCVGHLRDAEQQIQQLIGEGADGKPISQLLDSIPGEVNSGDLRRRPRRNEP